MSRTFEYDESEICDECGRVGAYDFYGTCLCPKCASEENPFDVIPDLYEDDEDEDTGG